MLTVHTKAIAFLDAIPHAEIDFTTSLVMNERTVEILGDTSPLNNHQDPTLLVSPTSAPLPTT
jgi:hypothetical protein